MLPLQLLRVRTRRGVVFPLFCKLGQGNGSGIDSDDLRLASNIIREFKEAAANRERKKELDNRLATTEALYDDYKLVRGLATLLERRCQFSNSLCGTSGENDNSDDGGGGKVAAGGSGRKSGSNQRPDAVSVRRALFEEAAKAGFALTEMERDNIVQSVAAKMAVTASYIKQALWSDLEENMILTAFEPIIPEELLKWYNLSLMQTLLFNCTSLEFSLSGGINWKRVLRGVKRLGLMYQLQRRQESGKTGQAATKEEDADSDQSPDWGMLVCVVDGPLSLFKLTDRYGTSIAKLLPSIISAGEWDLRASIVRKTMSGKKILEFKASSSEVQTLLLSSPLPTRNAGKELEGVQRQRQYAGTGTSDKSKQFDSAVEEKFATRFEQLTTGWKLAREPDPIIVSGGMAFIPDFVFEKHGRKVFLEIVGFWTEQYLERKVKKLTDAFSNKNVDLFIAINQDLECSRITALGAIPKGRVIYYKNDSVPVKPILDYLKEIDRVEVDRYVQNTDLRIKLDRAREIIPAEELASQFGIPLESAIQIALRDNGSDYLLANSNFVLKSKVKGLAALLERVVRYSDACAILSEQSVPESSHLELISKMGFNVVWQSMDANDAVIVKRKAAATTTTD